MDRGDTAGAIVQIRRRLRAGADQVFDLWTKPDLMARWMSPFPGAVVCQARCDPRPGGAFSIVMSSAESRREVSGGMSRSLLKFAERTLLFKSYAASAI
jgi:uncharacterized protein YndB with AHSA1/START domain